MYKLKRIKPSIVLIILFIGILLSTVFLNITLAQNNAKSGVEIKENEEQIHKPDYIKVKYREDPVDINHPGFEYLDTARSSFIMGAWYDADKSYMIIRLKGAYYQYCGMPLEIWNYFKRADSFGSFYNKYIKGNFDCRNKPVPQYQEKNIEISWFFINTL